MNNHKVNYYSTDVLVIGGGPAGAWAAWSAANSGARVILVDKGYLGSSGATAPGGTNLLILPPDQELRDQAVAMRMKISGQLAEPSWIYRVLDQVNKNLELVEEWGYPFVKDELGEPQRNHLHGPEYMAIMRKQVKKAGVKVLDQAPALELLVDEHGVGGARGVFRQRDEEWEIRANAVVIATGGCAFLSKGLGCNVLTGDGYLMAGEVGAELSGMEFSSRYAPSPAFSSNTRSRLLNWATYYDKDGHVLSETRDGDILARELLKGPVYAMMNKADTPEKQAMLRTAHTIFFLPYDRAGIDVFTEKFPLTLRYEGTVRGTGGLRITNENCATSVKGLYAAGDAATRERVAGAASGGGAYNASWAICSGTWAGEGAAFHAKEISELQLVREPVRAGEYGLRDQLDQVSSPIDVKQFIHLIQEQVLPLEINYFRSEAKLKDALDHLETLLAQLQQLKIDNTHDVVHAREAAAMAITARWMYTAALERKEKRGSGLHVLAEYPALDPKQQHRIIVSGIDKINISYDTSFYEDQLYAKFTKLKEVNSV